MFSNVVSSPQFHAGLAFYPGLSLFERRDIRTAERAKLKAAGYEEESWYFPLREDAARWALVVEAKCGVRLSIGETQRL